MTLTIKDLVSIRLNSMTIVINEIGKLNGNFDNCNILAPYS